MKRELYYFKKFATMVGDSWYDARPIRITDPATGKKRMQTRGEAIERQQIYNSQRLSDWRKRRNEDLDRNFKGWGWAPLRWLAKGGNYIMQGVGDAGQRFLLEAGGVGDAARHGNFLEASWRGAKTIGRGLDSATLGIGSGIESIFEDPRKIPPQFRPNRVQNRQNTPKKEVQDFSGTIAGYDNRY